MGLIVVGKEEWGLPPGSAVVRRAKLTWHCHMTCNPRRLCHSKLLVAAFVSFRFDAGLAPSPVVLATEQEEEE